VPTFLTAVFRQIGVITTADIGTPQTVQAQVYDSCSDPVSSGTVSVKFTNGDASLPLKASDPNNGIWSGTWVPIHYASQATASLAVNDTALGLSTTSEQYPLGLNNTDVPLITAAGIALPGLAPGGVISIYGLSLASNPNTAPIPLPTQLNSTQVQLSGEFLPLIYVGPTQINAVLPYDVNTSQTLYLVVEKLNTESVAIPVIIPAVAPEVFLQPTTSSSMQGAITNALTYAVANSAAPVSVGSYIAIYCTGLGAVSPAVTAGEPAPSNPPAQVTGNVTVTVGGLPATVQFAGLSPGSAGLYQVNTIVPTGVAPGPAVPVVVSVNGQASQPATIVVQ
jgi:uncharacterized protein (TIGR03437 family)